MKIEEMSKSKREELLKTLNDIEEDIEGCPSNKYRGKEIHCFNCMECKKIALANSLKK